MTGSLHPVGDVEGMAGGAVALLRDQARWKAASLAARDRAISLYSADRIVPEYEQYYEEVLSGALASLEAQEAEGAQETQEAQPVS